MINRHDTYILMLVIMAYKKEYDKEMNIINVYSETLLVNLGFLFIVIISHVLEVFYSKFQTNIYLLFQ